MKKISNIIIFVFSLYSCFFVIGSISAPLSAYFHNYELSAKLTSVYIYSCHQEPERSFWILGYPCALCCRCLGFYSGVSVGGLFALFNKLKISSRIFLVLFIFCFIDILINYFFGIRTYNTGNLTRFTVGIIMGLLFVTILQFIFKGKQV